MNIANLIIGALALCAATIAATYAVRSFRVGQEPRLTLVSSYPYFVLRNIGTTTARNITEKNGYCSQRIAELFNFSGPVNPIQSGNATIAPTITFNNINLGQKVTAIFEYENLSGQKFQSQFSVERGSMPESGHAYTIRETRWGRL